MLLPDLPLILRRLYRKTRLDERKRQGSGLHFKNSTLNGAKYVRMGTKTRLL